MPLSRPKQETSKNPKTDARSFADTIGMRFVRVPKGTFWMGGGGGKPGDKQVEITEDFELGVTKVTQGQWQAVMGYNPSYFSREGGGKRAVKNIPDDDLKEFPVESVSWDVVQVFLTKLNEKERGRGKLYRLPTETEWEYACRGGATSREECSYDFYLERPSNDLSSLQANFDGRDPARNAAKGPYLGRTCKVASYKPNGLGLYDMHGNVQEWCQDLYDGGPLRVYRVYRGGGWSSRAGRCRTAERYRISPSDGLNDLGLRLALVPSGK